MIRQICGVLSHNPLEMAFGQSVVLRDKLLFSVANWGQIRHDVADCNGTIRGRVGPALEKKIKTISLEGQHFYAGVV
jgi:hypothetical protein